MRPHLFVLNKMDIADADTNYAVKSALMRDYGIENVLFVSCKRASSIKHKVHHEAVICYSVYFLSFYGHKL